MASSKKHLFSTDLNSHYDQAFFQKIDSDSFRSAERIVPILLKYFNPKSVIDVGCGRGVWLSVFKKLGVENVLGLDGDYIEYLELEIDPNEFISHDLRQSFQLKENFDLALCLEVAEHLPASCASGLVSSLTAISPVILFSAAIPGQGGENHINEQWPEYWEQLFSEAGYLKIDLIRPLIWQDPNVAWYYRQNCLLYLRKSLVEADLFLQKMACHSDQNDLLLIRDEILAANLSLTFSLKRIPGQVLKILIRYLK